MSEIERARMIARQSQMERAIEYYTLIGVKPTMMELIATCDHLAQFVETGINKEIIEKTKKVDAFIESKKKS
jgi:hypothetical protein